MLNKNRKMMLGAALTAVVAAGVLTGCSSKSSSDTTPNTTAATEAAVQTEAVQEEAVTEAAQETEAVTEAAEAAEAVTEAAEKTEGTEVVADGLLAQIQEAGVMTVAMEGNWAPWTYEDEDGNLVGFEVEVADAVAEKLGVETEFITGEWDGLLAGVQTGRYDIMANGVGYSEERAQAYRYSDFYAFNRTVLVVRSDNEDITALEDLEGKTTCNSANSTYQLTAEAYGATVKDVESLAGTIEEVLAGRVDATLNAEVSINDYMEEQPDAEIKIVAYDPEVEQVGMIMANTEETASLQAAVNEALAELAEEGTLSEISEKYFGMDITENN